MDRFSFMVPGQPVGKQRARTVVKHGRVMSFTPIETREYERKVWLAARKAVGFHHQPWTGPVRVVVRAFMGDQRRRDLDNVVKSITDALNKKAYRDDTQIVVLQAWKFVDRKQPRVEVELTHVQADAWSSVEEELSIEGRELSRPRGEIEDAP